MPHSQIVERYLTRVILFKEKQDLYSEFADENKRTGLLHKLFKDLDFDNQLWYLRIKNAKIAFKVHRFLNSDYKLSHISKKQYDFLLETYLKKAIALDPYNPEYLKTYFESKIGTLNNNDKKLAIHYVSLYHPNSIEFQNLLVDLKLKKQDIVFDYLSETVTIPFINEMVFIKEKFDIELSKQGNQNDLESIAIKSGIGKETLHKINSSIPEMIKTTNSAVDDHWLSWDKALKAFYAIENAVDLAPYDLKVLSAAVPFYGKFYWRLVLGYWEIKSQTGKPEFMESVFGVKKPTNELIFNKAIEIFNKAQELKLRLELVLKNEAKQKSNTKQKDNDDDWLNIDFESIHDKMAEKFLYGNNRWLQYEDLDEISLEAFIIKEKITFHFLCDHFKTKKHSSKIVIMAIILTFPLCMLLNYAVFSSFTPFPPFYFPAFIVPALAIYFKEYLWKKNYKPITDDFNFNALKY